MVVTCICEIDTGNVILRVVYLSNIILLWMQAKIYYMYKETPLIMALITCVDKNAGDRYEAYLHDLN